MSDDPQSEEKVNTQDKRDQPDITEPLEVAYFDDTE